MECVLHWWGTTALRFELFPQFSVGPCRARHLSDIINHCLLPSLEKSLLATLVHPLTCQNTQNIYTFSYICFRFEGIFRCCQFSGALLELRVGYSMFTPCSGLILLDGFTRSDTFAWLRPLVFLKLKIGWTLGTAERHYQSSLKAFCFFYNDSCSCLMLWVHYWKGRNSFTVIFTLIQFIMQLQKLRVWKAPYKTR